jgi:DNA-binding NarL/FixJ family response regulator
MPACPNCRRENRTEAAFCDGCGAPLRGPTADAVRLPSRTASGTEVFVGREHELAALGAALEQTLGGQGQIVVLAGEPGIGKTRTAQVLARYAEQCDVRVLWGRCYEEPGAPPYWPWLQVIRAYAETQDDERLRAILGPGASDLAEIVPELAQRLPDLPPAPRSADATQARFRLFDAIAGFWKRAAADTAHLLILDNLHWADAPSLRLLEFLAPEVGGSRLLVLGTYRDMELSRHHPLSNTLGELARDPRFQRVRLTGLNLAEANRFMAAASGRPPPGELVSAVHSQTEGNPLFLGEVTRFLIQEGVLDPDASTAPLGASRSAALRRIPEGVKEVIGTRLNRLSKHCNAVLANAAAIGRTFAVKVLARLLDEVPDDQLVAALEEALAAAVIEPAAEPGSYQFRHALIRETLYDEIPAIRRPRLHLRIGATLEELHRGELTSHLSALAHHYCAALPGGDAAKAIEYARRAAERADALFAYEEAARYYQLALQALEANGTPDATQHCRLLIALGEAQTKAGENLQAAETLLQAAASAKAHGVAPDFARAAVGFEEATWRPGMPGDAAVRLLRDALTGLGEEDSILRAQVLSSLTRALIFSGALDEAMGVHEQAVAMARRIGDPATLAAALRAVVSARWLPAQFAARFATTLEATRLAEQVGDRERFLEAQSWRLFDLMEAGDLKARAVEFETYMRRVDELRQPFYQYIGVSSRAMQALFEGRFEECERFAQQALEVGQRMPGLDAAGIFGMQMFSLRREQGRLKELAPLVAHFVQTTLNAATWRPGLAVIYTELGLEDKARAEFEALATDGFAGVPQDGLWVTCIAYLAEVCAFLRDADRAAALYSALEPCDGRNIVAPPNVACFGAAARYLGMLAATMKRWPDAERHFEAALAMNARQGARPWLAHTQYQYAAMLLDRKRPEDRERALALLEEASALSRELGMQALAERAATLQQEAGSQPGKVRYPAGLSPREVEVLRLVAAGKGNREIAERLFVSPNTVANHVRSILTKTNTANRTEAAAFAVQHELLKTP